MKKNINILKNKIKTQSAFVSIKGGTKEIAPDLSVNDWACSNDRDCSTSTNVKVCHNFQICRS